MDNGVKPKGFELDLGEYGPQVYDGSCGEPIGWGFSILHYLGQEKWDELSRYGSLECLNGEHLESHWYLITKHLTKTDAIKKYGEITSEERGPRGGYRSVSYGEKKFISRQLDPLNI